MHKANKMAANDRIEYALAIKQWCDAHPGSTDDDLREFLERVEKKIVNSICVQSNGKLGWQRSNR